MSNEYINYSKEDLIREINRLKREASAENDETKYTPQILGNMIELRKTLSDVLSLLLNAEQSEVIDQALLVILRFFDVDRVYVGSFEEKECIVDFTHEVTCNKVISMREDLLRELSVAEIPWWIDQIKEGKDIIIPDVAKMPKEAAAEQHLLQLQEVVSLLALPVFHLGKVCGFIGLDCVKGHRLWNALDIENLRMLTDVISIAIERERAQGLMEHSMKQVLQSEAKFRIIFDKLPWGVELYDEKGNLLDLNNADLEIFGTTREQTVGLNAFRNPNIPEWVNDKLRKGEDVSFTLDYNFNSVYETGYYQTTVKKDGIKHLLVKGVVVKDEAENILGFFYIVFDNTENYQKAEQTKYNLTRLKVAVDTGDSIIWEYDVATDKLYIDLGLNENAKNNDFLSYLKKNPSLSLREFLNTLHPDDRHMFSWNFHRILSAKINNYVVVYRQILNGKTYWLNSNVRSYKYNEDGTTSKIISYTSNITKQRESEIELIKVKEADQLKSAFLANMSHEIRTPLNAIVGFSDLIAETSDEEDKASYQEIIHKNSDLLLNLISDILDFSKIEAGMLKYTIAETDIKDICWEVYLAGSLKMSPDVKLIFDNRLPSVIIDTDPQRVNQVITNFVSNATKFTSRGSITIFYETTDKEVKVSVKDTGIGIDEDNKSRIFERFIKLNDFKQGTGLGLTISKTIIETLGGSIGVESVKGEGSTFWFTLPLKDQEGKAATSPTE